MKDFPVNESVKIEELEEEEDENKKLMLEVEEMDEAAPDEKNKEDLSDPPATECSLWDCMERFDFPPSPQKTKPL
jgi:hypothetical protein